MAADAALAAANAAAPAGQVPRLSIINLGVVFPGRGQSSATEVLSNVNLDIQDHEFLSILGPSGCGKTTLLNVVAGFLSPSRGEVRMDGKPITRPGPDRGVVFQQGALFPWLTVRGNIEYGLKVAGVPAEQRQRRVEQWMELVHLKDTGDKWPYQLSGGMQQRVGIARALAIEPKVLLMDEPFGALDAQTRMILQNELMDIWRRHQKTVLFITHDIMEALLLSDRIVVMMQRGKICAELRPDVPRPRSRTDPRLLQLYEQISEVLGLHP